MKCIYIYNPKSGKGKAEKNKDYIIKTLQEKFEIVDVCPTTHAGHAKELAKNACGNYEYLVVAGGDGTLNEIVNGIAEEENKPIIAYIPLGTVNDVAHSLTIPRNIKKAVKLVSTGKVIEHDIFKVNGHYGIYVCAMGVATETSYATNQKAKKALGKSAYFIHGFKKLFTTKSFPLKLSYESGVIKGNFALMLILNSRCVASFKVNKSFKYDDGMADIILVKENSKKVRLSALCKVAKIFLFGTNKQMRKNTLHLKLSKFEAEVPENLIINLDGESHGAGKFQYEVISKAIKFVVPQKR